MTTYYVSSGTGADKNAGTSAASAFATLQQAANKVQPGDTVEVESGTYTAPPGQYGIMVTQTSGTASAPITFEAAPGAHPVIDNSGSQAGIVVTSSYVTISGFEIEGNSKSLNASSPQGFNTTDENGIIVQSGDSSHPTTHDVVENNVVHDEPLAGIRADEADDVSILNNTTYGNANWSNVGGSGISLGFLDNSGGPTPAGGYNNVIAGNVSYDNRELVASTGIGSSTPTDGNGIIVDSNNNDGYTGTTLVENNVAYGNGGTGMHATKSDNVTFLYNTAYGNNQTSALPEGQIAAMFGSNDVIENNIMDATGSATGVVNNSYGGTTYDYNLYYGGKVGAQGAHDIVADPNFVSPGTGNFALQSNSPAIGHANPAFIAATDIAGAPRPSGAGSDIGAYQYQGPSAAAAPALTTAAAATAPAASSAATSGSGADTLTVTLSEDAWLGDAQASISLDGTLLTATPVTVTALHAAGAGDTFTFAGNFGIGPHDLAVSFLNDAWGGTPSTDRNLYVNAVSYDGNALAQGTAALYTTSTTHFQIPALTSGS